MPITLSELILYFYTETNRYPVIPVSDVYEGF